MALGRHGALGEPLFQDVITALAEAGRTDVKVLGGRYGLGSKEFNPSMAKAVFDELTRVPYLDEIVFLFVASEDAQAIRFQAGETDVISRLSAENFAVLSRDQEARGFRLHDLGPGLHVRDRHPHGVVASRARRSLPVSRAALCG